jgi:NAD(P)-dependent dehydrogenase (short-subunit alcohol dehydrogenase family)
MAAQFDGKVALVTGAGSGIGREVAIAFAAERAKVVVADISEAGGQETVGLIKQAGGDACFVRCDVTSASECRAAVAATVEAYGRLDCAFNNAGIMGPRMHVHEYSEQDFEQVVRIHLFGVFYCLKYELIQMQKQGGGAIVNTSSVAGLLGSPLGCAYTAAKHGIAGLTKAAAVDNGLNNIRVNAVCPGIIDTALTRTAFPQGLEERAAQVHPNGRIGQPREVAAAVLFLCSDAASLVTGITMPVDGGWTATM